MIRNVDTYRRESERERWESLRRSGRRLMPTLRPICELAEDMGPWNRLRRVLDIVRS